MIFTDRTITVRKGESRMDEPIVVYRGDYELEVRFTILNSRFKFMSGTNMIESEKASYGQLAILTPYGGNIFSDIVRCNDGSVTFVLTAEMLNQIEEVGLYSFQIRLMDYNKESRVSIPPIEFGIEVREPIASEDHDNSVNNAIVGYSIAKVVDPKEEKVGDTFDEDGNYNKTKWETGDRISEGKLNKIEDALDKINQNEKADVAALDKRVTNNFNVLDANKADRTEIDSRLWSMANMGQDVKEAMTGGSVAVVGKNSVLRPNIVNNQVTPEKTNFIMVGKNKFDGNYIPGAITTVNGDISTMKIEKTSSGGRLAIVPIVSSMTYTIRFHDTSNKRRWGIMNSYPIISDTAVIMDTPLYHNDFHSGPYTFTNTAEGKYLVLYVSNIGQTPRLQIEEGSEETEYEEYCLNLSNSLNIKDLNNDIVNASDQIININHNVDRLYNQTLGISSHFIYNLFDGNYIGVAILTDSTCGLDDNYRSAIIPIKPNTTYTVRRFDQSNRFRVGTCSNYPVIGESILIVHNNNKTQTCTFTTSEEDKYIIITVSNANEEPRLCVIEGNTCNEYLDPFEYTLRVQDDIDLINNTVRGMLSNFIGSLFDGVYHAASILVYNDDATKLTYDLDDNCRSAIIPIKPNTTYTVRRFDQSNRFRVGSLDHYPAQDDLLTFICVNGSTCTFTTSEEDKYIIIMVSNANEEPRLCVVEGDTCDEYLGPFEYEVVGGLAHTVRKFYFLDDLNGVYSCPKDIPGGSVNDSVNLLASSCDVIYEIYDKIVNDHPNYVTKVSLGKESSGVYDIYQYTFSPTSIINNSRYGLEKFKIVIQASIHGYEQGAGWCLAQFFDQLCNYWEDDERLEFMRFNVEFVVIPVGNPWGFSNNTRGNYNGVDVNRNFDAGWSYGNTNNEYYSGASAMSEVETQIISKFIEDNLDAEWFIDYHNISGGYPLFYLVNDEQTRLCNSVFRTLTRKWNKEYGIAEDVKCYCKTGVHGTFAAYADKLGANAFTFETPWTMPVAGKAKYDQNTIITGVDALANTLIAILKSYK